VSRLEQQLRSMLAGRHAPETGVREPAERTARAPDAGQHRVLSFDEAEAGRLYRRAFGDAVAPGRPEPASAVVWLDGAAELLIRADAVRLACLDSLLLVGVPVFCEELGDAEVVVPFALAQPTAAGLLRAATETLPRGPAQIVERWGEEITGAAWEALVALADAVAVAVDAGDRRPATVVAAPKRLRFYVGAAESAWIVG